MNEINFFVISLRNKFDRVIQEIFNLEYYIFSSFSFSFGLCLLYKHLKRLKTDDGTESSA